MVNFFSTHIKCYAKPILLKSVPLLVKKLWNPSKAIYETTTAKPMTCKMRTEQNTFQPILDAHLN